MDGVVRNIQPTRRRLGANAGRHRTRSRLKYLAKSVPSDAWIAEVTRFRPSQTSMAASPTPEATY